MPKRIDLTGQKFNSLTVLGLDEVQTKVKKKTFWICQCDCGNIKSVWSGNLKNGHTKSCGCQSSRLAFIDETGNRYGKLLVIERAPNKDSHVMWKCRCDCGNEVVIYASSLRNGVANSCGCSRIKDEIGKIYGNLEVIEQSKKQSTKGERYWKCRCKCGTITEVKGSHLRSGQVTSCGCVRSKGEEQIAKYLTKHNIIFKKEYSFQDLKYRNALRFDFAIFDNKENLLGLIEYQGIQHYKDVDWGKQQREITDKLKQDYCIANFLKLFIINYKEDINTKLPQILQQLVVAEEN